MKAKNTYAINTLLFLAIFSIIAAPLLFKHNAAYEGTDDIAVNVAKEIAPGYTRWFRPFWEPPTENVEHLLFAFQAVIGLAFIAYYFGHKKRDRRTIGNSESASLSASSKNVSSKPGTGRSSDDRQVRILKRPE
jgi:cobalt/nickel transport protein